MSGRLRLAVAVLAVLGLSTLAAAAPPRRPAPMELDRHSIALGEALQLRLTRALLPGQAALESLDLAPLQRDFEIVERTLGRDSAQETLTLTLYPRRAGQFTLPALGQAGRAPRVTVSDGSASLSRVQWKLSVEPEQPLVRQPVTFTLEACDDGSLLWKRPSLPSVEGLLVRPLNETEIITTRDGQRCTAHRWHWALLPTAAGALQLPLPVLEAGKFGQRLRFMPPALALRAEPLPAWLPAEAAVGPPEFSAEPLPSEAELEQPLAWRLRVSGAYSAPALQQLLAWQLRASDARLGLDRYAPRIEPQAAAGAAPQYRVTLYLAPRARGTLPLPALQLPWYDPASGQLRQAQLAPPPLAVVDAQRQRWLRAAAVLGALLAGAALAAWVWRLGAWRLQRWRAARRLLRAPSLEALWAELQGYGRQRGEAPAPTLLAWQARMAARFEAAALPELVRALEQARFGHAAAPADVAALARLAADCLRAGRRRR